MTRHVSHCLVAKHRPPRPGTAEHDEQQAQAIAAQLAYCMAENIAPRNVRLDEQETAKIVGFPIGGSGGGKYQIPLVGARGHRRLADLLHVVRVVQPAVWSRAVEIAGGRAWREFEMRQVARAATSPRAASGLSGTSHPRVAARTPHSEP